MGGGAQRNACGCMRDWLATFFTRVPNAAHGSNANCMGTLREQFGPHDKHKLYLAELLAHKRQ